MHCVIQKEAGSNFKKKNNTITNTDGNMETILETGQAEGREINGRLRDPE